MDLTREREKYCKIIEGYFSNFIKLLNGIKGVIQLRVNVILENREVDSMTSDNRRDDIVI